MDDHALLKIATAQKRSGDMDAAIASLRQAYAVARPDTHPIDVYLRLPKYLHLNRRGDEAWAEYHRLLRAQRDPAMGAMNRSLIYDAMRLHVERDGRYQEACTLRILSYLEHVRAYIDQGRAQDKVQLTTVDIVALTVGSALRRIHRDDCIDAVVTLLHARVTADTVSPAAILREVRALLRRRSGSSPAKPLPQQPIPLISASAMVPSEPVQDEDGWDGVPLTLPPRMSPPHAGATHGLRPVLTRVRRAMVVLAFVALLLPAIVGLIGWACTAIGHRMHGFLSLGLWGLCVVCGVACR